MLTFQTKVTLKTKHKKYVIFTSYKQQVTNILAQFSKQKFKSKKLVIPKILHQRQKGSKIGFNLI